jgi:hypothetical protein
VTKEGGFSVSNIVIPAKAGIQLHFAGARSGTPTFVGVTKEGGFSVSNIVIPAKAGIQLHFTGARSGTPTFVGVTSVIARPCCNPIAMDRALLLS